MTSSRAQLPPLPTTIGTLNNADAADLNRRRPDTIHTPAQCKTCGGDRVFLWYADLHSRDDDVVEYDCPCVDQYLLLRWLSHCGVYESYARLGWADLISPDPKVVEQITEYVDHRQAYLARGLGLVLTGPRGTGKTMLSNLLLKDLISHGVDCYATTFGDLIQNFASGFGRSETKPEREWFERRVRNAKVLLIDDLGREKKQQQRVDERGQTKVTTDLAENTLESVIRYRVGCNMPTLMTTNLTEQEVAMGYGGHTMSLLTEKSIFLTVPGADYRAPIQSRTMKEIRLGIKQRPVVLA